MSISDLEDSKFFSILVAFFLHYSESGRIMNGPERKSGVVGCVIWVFSAAEGTLLEGQDAWRARRDRKSLT